MTDQTKLISVRTGLLAKVFLTQKPAVVTDIHDVPGLDFFVQLSPEDNEKPSPIPAFGVFAKGTIKPLADKMAANHHLATYWEKAKVNRFAMPFLGLLFSMNGDVGYWSWLYEPMIHEHSRFPGLQVIEHPNFQKIEATTAKETMTKIVEWYSVLGEIVFEGH